MSRNSKNTRLIRQAKQMSAQRKSGSKGPAKTASAHGKRQENCTWFQKKWNLLPKKRQKRQGADTASTEPEAVITA